MTKDERDAIFIAERYGRSHQVEKMIEELEELIEAAREWQEEPSDKAYEHLIEEVADVRLMTWQVVYLMDAFTHLEFFVNQKIRRQLARIKEGA